MFIHPEQGILRRFFMAKTITLKDDEDDFFAFFDFSSIKAVTKSETDSDKEYGLTIFIPGCDDIYFTFPTEDERNFFFLRLLDVLKNDCTDEIVINYCNSSRYSSVSSTKLNA